MEPRASGTRLFESVLLAVKIVFYLKVSAVVNPHHLSLIYDFGRNTFIL